MRVATYIDGKFFHSGWRDAGDARRLHFGKMADWLVKEAGGTKNWGSHYYTSVSDSDDKLSSFLDVLEGEGGYFVHRIHRRSQKSSCLSCGASNLYTVDTEVDTSLAVDLVMGAAKNAFDIAVVICGDTNQQPAIKAAAQLGKKVVLASWGGAGVSFALRRAAFHQLDLLQGLSLFERTEADDQAAADAALENPDVFDRSLEVFEEELKLAEEKFSGGYVGLGYFVTRWRAPALDSAPEVRRRLLDTLVDEGRVDIYSAPDGAQAIRLLAE